MTTPSLEAYAKTLAVLQAKQKPLDFRPNDPVGWIEDHFRIPRDEVADMRLHLEDYQRIALREALSRDSDGLFKYSIVLWGDIKKSIKSCIAAAVILWRAWHSSHARIHIVANDLKQADSRVMYYLRRAVELHPELSAKCQVRPSGYTIMFPNRTVVEAIPVDPKGEAGSNDIMIEWTELWGATTDAHKLMWTEMATPPNLFGKSMRWVDSYAGFSGESQLLEQLYDLCIKSALRIHPEYELYANPAARMFAMWNTTPRMPWQTNAYYASEASILTPSEFNRIHRNQWSSPIETFVPMEWWEACRNEIETNKTDIIVGSVDGAVSNDSFGIVLLSKKAEKTYVRYARCWYPPPGGEIDFVGTLDNPGPELEIVRLNKQYHVIDWVYDMTHIADMMSRLRYKHSLHVNKFSQGNDRLVADKALYDAIRDRRIVHSSEPDLTEHVANSRAEIPVKGHETLRIVKGTNPQKKIDLCVAMSMANYTIRETYNIS